MKIERAAIERVGLGESALWDARTQAFYFLDVWGKKVLRYDPATDKTTTWTLPGVLNAMGLGQDSRLLLAMTDTFRTLDVDTGDIADLAGPAFEIEGATVNDGAVDQHGRFVFGVSHAGIEDPKPVGGLYALDLAHGFVQLDGGVHHSNGHCFSPDGKTLYCADSFLHDIYAYDYDLETGQVANKRVLANTEDLGGKPDGAAVDADGILWSTLWGAGKVCGFRPDGALERTIDMPARLVASCAWGGPELDRLYVVTIDPSQFGLPSEETGGYTYFIDGLGTRGVPEPVFAM